MALQFNDFIWSYDSIVWHLVTSGLPFRKVRIFAEKFFVLTEGEPTALAGYFQTDLVNALKGCEISKTEMLAQFRDADYPTKINYNKLYDAVAARGLFSYGESDDTDWDAEDVAMSEADKYHGIPFTDPHRSNAAQIPKLPQTGDFRDKMRNITGVLRKIQPLVTTSPLYGPMFSSALDAIDSFSGAGRGDQALMALNVAMDATKAHSQETGDFRDDLFAHPNVNTAVKEVLNVMKDMKDDPVYESLSRKVK